MNGIMIIGTGGAGGAIASYIQSKNDRQIPIAIIDSDRMHKSDTVPVHHISGETVDSKVRFEQLMDSITSQFAPSELIILSGFIGKKTAQLMHRFQTYCAEHQISFQIAGVTPFRFEGMKKAHEAQTCIADLQDQGIAVSAFSNNDLLDKITAQFPIEQAITINYDRILNEVIIPHLDSMQNTTIHTEELDIHHELAQIKRETTRPVFHQARLYQYPEKQIPKAVLYTLAVLTGTAVGLLLNLFGLI